MLQIGFVGHKEFGRQLRQPLQDLRSPWKRFAIAQRINDNESANALTPLSFLQQKKNSLIPIGLFDQVGWG